MAKPFLARGQFGRSQEDFGFDGSVNGLKLGLVGRDVAHFAEALANGEKEEKIFEKHPFAMLKGSRETGHFQISSTGKEQITPPRKIAAHTCG